MKRSSKSMNALQRPTLKRCVYCVAILLCICFHSLLAQSNALLQCWTQFYLKHKTAQNWLLEADAGYRSHTLHLEPGTTFGRIGFGRQFKEWAVTAGLAWFETWPKTANALGIAEMRLFQKVNLQQKLGPLNLNHIYRIEERWLQQHDRIHFRFQWRFRYQLQANFPLKKLAFLKAKPFLVGHAEIFLRPDQGIFSQFRAFGGIGLNWNDRWKWDVGYIAFWLPGIRGVAIPGQGLRMTVTFSF